ncbi:hypothetical protein ERJ75_001294200 [Trypanosoma vivax]|nr:hypothetical protein ERJ75_001297900 [Trypanosoma vivax]KAH8608573.1 hypothetical protein ERJ75_001294200 [Trypanosoma vivax]
MRLCAALRERVLLLCWELCLAVRGCGAGNETLAYMAPAMEAPDTAASDLRALDENTRCQQRCWTVVLDGISGAVLRVQRGCSIY